MKLKRTELKTDKGEDIFDGDVFVNHGWSNVVVKRGEDWYVAYAGGYELLKNQLERGRFDKLGNCLTDQDKFEEENAVWKLSKEDNIECYDDILESLGIRRMVV